MQQRYREKRIAQETSATATSVQSSQNESKQKTAALRHRSQEEPSREEEEEEGPSIDAAVLVAKDATSDPLALKQVLLRVGDLHKVRQRLSAEIAEGSNLLKSLLLRAEDYRAMGDM